MYFKRIMGARTLFRGCVLGFGMSLAASALAASELLQAARQWEDTLGGRIGVVLIEQGGDWQIAYRADERFAMTSTFKTLLCGAVLARVDTGDEELSHQVAYGAEALVSYSPVTKDHAGAGMTVGALCAATMTLSDNSAANLLLERVGGPEGLTAFLRGIGDADSRLDRWETDLNSAIPDDLRDTTTPRTMIATMEQLLFGDVLSAQSAAQLREWMAQNAVADTLIRDDLPEGWHMGDRTGAGGNGARALTGYLRTPQGQYYLLAIYIAETEADFETRNAAISDLGTHMLHEIARR